MRWIDKRRAPPLLTTWQLKNAADINFGYDLMRTDQAVRQQLAEKLLAEQGDICAYTGRRIGPASFHMEHVKPQDFCTPAEAVDYFNIVACYPEPNRGQPCPYGADYKGHFPEPGQEWLFVSPLDRSCELRFRYTYNGHIRAADENDRAAQCTIEKLNLDHDELKILRRAAIQAILAPGRKQISPAKAKHLLKVLEKPQAGQLAPFHFALVQAVRNHLKRGKGEIL
jgi:uncharacterized protein (TIGR02646 family)